MKILDEIETITSLHMGCSIARFGDGELRLAIGGSSASQKADKALAKELRAILQCRDKRLLPAIPRAAGPRAGNWAEYLRGKYLPLFSNGIVYGSAFISRPDSAPWIDTPGFWASCRDLWAGKDALVVRGNLKSLHAAFMPEARSVREVIGPERDAYAEIDRLVAECADHPGPIIICLGAAGTVLAARLALMGRWALDLGHMGMFMRHAGAYRYQPDDLVSPAYRRLLAEQHRGNKKWGTDGAKHAAPVIDVARQIGGTNVLDYGAGKGAIAEALRAAGLKVQEYEPAIPEKAKPPKPADLVFSSDVLEHVEADRIDNVIDHVCRLARRGIYLVIACRPAKAILPDGRNAHLIVADAAWWASKVRAIAGECFTWNIEEVAEPAEVRMTGLRRS